VNLGVRLLDAASRSPDATALVGDDGSVSYDHLAGAAGRLARHLAHDHDVAPGDRVVLIARNEGQFVAGYLATLLAAGIATPLEPDAPEAELVRYAASVRPAAVVASPGTASSARAVADATNAPLVVLDAEVGERLSTLEPLDPVERDIGDPAALMFTSGTAGAPKAAVLTHGSLAANLDQVRAHPLLALTADDVGLGIAPFSHVLGLNPVLAAALDAGATLVMVPHFDPRASLDAMKAHRVTMVAAVPAMFQAWLAVTDAPTDAFASARLVVSGATFLPGDVHAGMRDRFGVEVHEGYGLTEASPVVTSAVVDGPARVGSVGAPLPGVEVRLVDIDGSDALAGDPGEIWVRGPNVFGGYWEAPDDTARVLVDGWLRTGDVAVADADGWLRLVDRAKDLVKVSGFNVFPAEVEEQLVALPGVAEAAVVGAPDPRTGETVHAYVVAEPGVSLEADTVVAGLRGRLARYKLPTRVDVVAELPRTFGGKLLRRALADDGVDTRKPA
jgi:long-chain acyl-CoA synthetase